MTCLFQSNKAVRRASKSDRGWKRWIEEAAMFFGSSAKCRTGCCWSWKETMSPISGIILETPFSSEKDVVFFDYGVPSFSVWFQEQLNNRERAVERDRERESELGKRESPLIAASGHSSPTVSYGRESISESVSSMAWPVVSSLFLYNQPVHFRAQI